MNNKLSIYVHKKKHILHYMLTTGFRCLVTERKVLVCFTLKHFYTDGGQGAQKSSHLKSKLLYTIQWKT